MKNFKKKRKYSKKKKIIDGRECLVIGCSNICNYRGHHIKSIGAGGTDDDFNIAPLCPDHHNMTIDSVHKMGIMSFARKHPEFKEYLLSKGWEYCDVTEKFYHQEYVTKKYS